MDSHPELDGYEPFEQKPLRSQRFQRFVKGIAVLGILLLVVPIVASQFSVASGVANQWCTVWVNHEINEPATADARFEVFGPGFLGWECYATNMVGGDRYLGNLGIIPGAPDFSDNREVSARAY